MASLHNYQLCDIYFHNVQHSVPSLQNLNLTAHTTAVDRTQCGVIYVYVCGLIFSITVGFRGLRRPIFTAKRRNNLIIFAFVDSY